MPSAQPQEGVPDLGGSPSAKKLLLQHSGIMGRTGANSPKRMMANRSPMSNKNRTVSFGGDGTGAIIGNGKRPQTAGAVSAESDGHSTRSSRGKKMSDGRLQKLLYLRQREEMKDVLIHEVKQKFFRENPEAAKKRGLDELGRAIENQVNKFSQKNAKLSKANLDKLMKRVEIDADAIAKKQIDGVSPSGKSPKSNCTGVSEYSHLSNLSHASQASAASNASHVERMQKGRELKDGKEEQSEGAEVIPGYNEEGYDPDANASQGETEAERNNRIIRELMGFDWARLDEYQNRLIQDEEAAKAEVREKHKVDLKHFLDGQVQVVKDRKKKEAIDDYSWKYVVEEELEKFRLEDLEKEEHMKKLAHREKTERDIASALKAERLEIEREEVRQEDVRLLAKVQREIETALKKEAEAKAEKMATMLKVKKDIEYAKKLREEEEKIAKEEEMKRAKAYTKLLLKQEEEKKAELAKRNERQKYLMEKMKSSVSKAAASKGAEDERRANLQRQEKEELQAEIEENKVEKLRIMREENRDFILKQIALKNMRKGEHRQVKAAQGGILLEDAEAFEQDKVEAVLVKKQKARDHVVELREQIRERAARRVKAMTESEVRLNRPLIEKVIADEQMRGIDPEERSKPVHYG